jgi:WD40 repeat protein
MQPATPLPRDAVELKGHRDAVWRVVALPGGERIATASWDSAVRLFFADTGDCLHTLIGHSGWVGGLAALGGDVLASSDEYGVVILWDAVSGDRLCSVKVGVYAFALTALGADRFLASADGDLVFFSHNRGRDVAQQCKISGAHADWIRDIAVCGVRFATASDDKTAAVWCASTYRRLAVLDGHIEWVLCVALSEKHLLTGSRDETIRLYDAHTLQFVRCFHTLHSNWVYSLEILGGEHVLSASQDKTVLLTRLDTSFPVARIGVFMCIPRQLRSPVESQWLEYSRMVR